jgi:amino acid transporter, AAT family
MIVFGLAILIFGIGPEGNPASFTNLWAHGGFLPHGLWGLLSSLVVVTFSFGGTELIGITAGEAENPETTIPHAVNMTISRILIFYVGAIFVLVCLYPWNLVGSKGSPFVEIFDALGIPAAPDILNVVVIIAVFSAYNSCLYSNARMLHGLALHGDAPKFLARLSDNGIPYRAVLFSSFFVSAVIGICYFLPDAAFTYIMSVVTVAVITSWILILLTHIQFRRYLGKESDRLTFKMIGYPFIDLLSIAYFLLIIVTMALLPGFRHAIFLAPVWFAVIAVGYRLSRRKHT